MKATTTRPAPHPTAAEPQPHPLNDEERAAQQLRLEEKRQIAIALLGDRHVLKGGSRDKYKPAREVR